MTARAYVWSHPQTPENGSILAYPSAVLTIDGREVGWVHGYKSRLYGKHMGWYWTAVGPDIRYRNTCLSLSNSFEETRAECEAYCRGQMGDDGIDAPKAVAAG